MKVRTHNIFIARAGKCSVSAVLFLSFSIQLLLFSPGFSDDDYSTWVNWRYVYLITNTNGANVTGEVYDVPVLIRLNPGNFDGLTSTADDGSDIRFSKEDGTHLYYDIERWQHTSSTIDTAEIWVLVDTVKDSDTTKLKMYWNKTGAVDSSYSEKVFDTENGFAGVWHMDSSESGIGTADVYLDATGNGNHGDDSTGSDGKTGIIGEGQEFDGSDDCIALGDISSSDWSAITIGAWINLDVDQTGERAIIRKNSQFQLGVLPSGDEIRNLIATSGTTGWTTANDESYTIATGTWYYFACTYNDAIDSLKHYANGSQVGDSKHVSGTVTDNSNRVGIGANTGGGSLNLDGYIDEVRISSEARSADWIKLCYQNQRLTDGRDSLVWFSASFTTDFPYTWDVNESSGFQAGDGTWGTHDYWSESTGDGTSPGAYPGANTITTFAGSNGPWLVTISGTQTADSVAFLNSYYNLSGGTSLTISRGKVYVASGLYDTISTVLAGTDGLTKSGDGTLTIKGANSYSGATTISGGTLLVNNTSGSGTGTGDVTVADGATLGGTGTITGDVTVNSGGTLTPGTGTGTITIDDLTMSSGSYFSVELNGTSVETQYDQLIIDGATGTVALGSATLSITLGFAPSNGNTFTIIDNDDDEAVSGTFNGISEGGSTSASYSGTFYGFTVSYTGGTDNDVVLTCTGELTSDDYSQWPYSQKIQINTSIGGAMITTNQYDFPLLLRLDSTRFHRFDQTFDDGADIRFANKYGEHLYYDIERWVDNTDDNDSAAIWVLVDTISANSWSNYITMYWGKSGAVDSSYSEKVFDTANGFAGVWHFADNDPFSDATINDNDGANNNTTNDDDGIIGTCRNFASASSQDISVAYDASLDRSSYTVSAWTNQTTTGSLRGILGTRFDGDNTFDLKWDTDKIHADIGSGSDWLTQTADYSTTPATSVWNYVVYTVTDGAYKIYFDSACVENNGSFDETPPPQFMKEGQTMHIGNCSFYGEYFNGKIDEVRIDRTVRSADWIKLCYETQKSVTDTIVDIENYADWSYSQNLYINTTSSGADISGDVYNFPLLVRLDTSNFDGFANTLANGDDIRFSKSNGVHLPYEIERWKDGDGDNDTAAIWVLVDTVFGNKSNQYISIYYGKSGATSRSNSRVVFDTTNGFGGVWHLDESSGNFADATTNAYTGTDYVDATGKTGAIGSGQQFASSSTDYIDLVASSTLFPNTSQNFTMSAWFNAASIASGTIENRIMTIHSDDAGNSSVAFSLGLDDKIQFYSGSIYDSDTTIGTGTWYYAALTWDGTDYRIYFNGSPDRDPVTAGLTAGGSYVAKIGSRTDASAHFDGYLDEVRFNTTARSADWIKLCYQTQRSDQITVTLEEVALLPITVNFGAKAARGNDTCEIYTDDWKIIFDEDVGGGIKWLSYEKTGPGNNELAAGTNLFYIKTGGQTSNNMSGTLTLLDTSSLFATVRQNFSIGTPTTHPWQIEYTVYGCGRAFVRVETEALTSNYTPTGGLEFRVETDVSNKEYSAEDDDNANLSNYILHSDKGSGKYDVLLALYEDWQYEGFDSASGFTVETGDYYGYVDDNWDLPAGNKRVWEFLLDFGHRKWNDTAGVGKVVDDYRDENDRDSLEFIKGTYRMEKSWEHGLTGHWPFDDGSGSTADDVADASNDHNGAVNNATWVDGVWNGALDFDGTGDDVTVTSNKADFNAIVFTIMMWVKPETGTPLSTSTVLFSKWSSNTGYKLAGNSGKLELTLDGTTITANNSIGTNLWKHVAVTYHHHSGRIKFYVDGKIDRYAVSQYSVTSNTDDVVIGEGFVGLMDDVRLYKTEISEETIRAISQNGYRVNQGQYMLRADNNNTVHIKIDGSAAEPEYFPIFQIDNYWAAHTPYAVYYDGSRMASTGDYITSLNDADNILYLGFNKKVTSTDLHIYIDDTDSSGAFMVGAMPKMYWSAGTHFSAQNFSGTDFGETGSDEFYLYWKMNTTANEKNGEINAFKSSEISGSASGSIGDADNTIYESDIYTFGMFVAKVNDQDAFSSSEVDATPSYAVLESSDVRIRLQIDERGVDGANGYDITTIWTLYPTGQIFRYDTIDNLDANFTEHWIYFLQKYEVTGISYYDDNTNLRGGVYGGSATHDFAVCVLGTADKNGSTQLISGAADPVYDFADSPHREGIGYHATDDLVTTDAPFKYAYYLDIQKQTMDDTYMDAVCDGVQNIDYNSADFSGGTGALVDTTEGDLNGDGFNEAEGAYVMRADDNSVNFLFEATTNNRYYPAFRILEYYAKSKPGHVQLYNASDTVTLLEDYGYNCYLNNAQNELILQLDTVLTADTKIYISYDDDLAVEMSDFYAKAGDGNDTLFWKTESEEDNLGFFLYRRIKPEFLDSLSGVIDSVADSLLDNAGKLLKQGTIGYEDTKWISLTKEIIPTQYKPGEVPGITRKYMKIDWDVENDIVYEYKLIAIDKSRLEEEFGPIQVIPQIRLPKRFFLFHNFPNPARFYTNFRFDLPQKSKVSLYVYNLQGRLIARILRPDRYMKPGFYRLRWKCMDQQGRKIASGPYIYRFVAKGINKKKYAKNRMMILIK